MLDSTDVSFFVRLLDRSRSDIEVARQGLEIAVKFMQDKINELNAALVHLQVQRRQLLESKVSQLLPDFSSSTLHALELACPGFVDALVHATFKANRKVLGIFTRTGSPGALATLQIRLAFYLDAQKSPDQVKIDAQIASTSQEKENWERARFARASFITVLEQAQASGDISDEMQEDIHQLAEQTRQLAVERVNAATQKREASVNETVTHTSQSTSTYDHASWAYLGNKKYFQDRQQHYHTRNTTYNNSYYSNNERNREQNDHWQAGQLSYANTVFSPQFDSSDMFHNTATGYVPATQFMPTESASMAPTGDIAETPQTGGMADLYDCNSSVIVGNDIRTDDSLGSYS